MKTSTDLITIFLVLTNYFYNAKIGGGIFSGILNIFSEMLVVNIIDYLAEA